MENTARNFSLGDFVAKNMQLASQLNEKMWNMMMVSLGGFSWLNEQWENMAQTYINQRKSMREEFVKLTEQMVEQLHRNFKQVESILNETVTATTENVPEFPAFTSYQELVKKVEELSKKIEQLDSKN